MSKVSTDERFGKVTKLLITSTEKKIARILAIRGFSDEDRQEGWSLFDRAAGRHMVIAPGPGTFMAAYRPTLTALDEWENTWFDVANAALGRSFPSVRDHIFFNLSKMSGDMVLLSVRTFLQRLEALAAEGSEESR